MDVILLTKVANLGDIGDRVNVKSGYGRNFLLPSGKATLATPANVAKFEARRAELEKIAHDELADATRRADAMKEFKLQITAKAGSEGKLFGSIHAAEIAAAIKEQTDIDIDRKSIEADHNIKTTGQHTVTASLHHDVSFPITLEVVAAD